MLKNRVVNGDRRRTETPIVSLLVFLLFIIGTVSLFFVTWWAPFVAVAAYCVTFRLLPSSW